MRRWARNYENGLFWAIFGYFWDPMIFKIWVVVAKSQEEVKLQKIKYLIFNFCMQILTLEEKNIKNGPFWA